MFITNHKLSVLSPFNPKNKDIVKKILVLYQYRVFSLKNILQINEYIHTYNIHDDVTVFKR